MYEKISDYSDVVNFKFSICSGRGAGAAAAGLPDLSAMGLNGAGFEKIAPLAAKLTPEQKAGIMQALMMLKTQWDGMPKDQQQSFLKNLMDAYTKFDFKKADPKQLDTNKMQDLGAVSKDLDAFLNASKKR